MMELYSFVWTGRLQAYDHQKDRYRMTSCMLQPYNRQTTSYKGLQNSVCMYVYTIALRPILHVTADVGQSSQIFLPEAFM
jgi:hypothetical protein